LDKNREFVGHLKMHTSDSTEQRNAEQSTIEALAVTLRVELKPRVIQLDKAKVQIDGCSANQRIMAEVYSGMGVPKPGHVKKVLADAFKLIAVERFLQEPIDKYLCFIDAESYNYFAKGHWYSEAFETFGVKATLVELPVDVIESVKEARSRQGFLFRKAGHSIQS
jgi:hypothetical protein